MTDPQFIAWLKSDSRIHCVLVEVVANINGADTTLYLSNRGYVTGSADAPANTAYQPHIKGGITIQEQLPINGSPSMAFGDVELTNNDGLLDGWLKYVWANRSIKVYVGDMRWARSAFRLVFSGLVQDITSRDRTVLNLKITDKLQQLNTSLSDTVLGGTTVNADKLIPLTFGECHNITPLLVDAPTLKYQFHNGTAESLIEVRDNGVPVPATVDLTTGTFTLPSNPAGTLTASVQGAQSAGSYINTIGQLVPYIAKTYGTTPLTSADIDTAQIAAFDTAHPQPVGSYCDSRTNVIQVCQDIAASVGAQLAMSTLGKLRLLQIALPATGTPTVVTETNMVEKTLHVSDRPTVAASMKLGYCKNWTVQTGLLSGIPTDHRMLFEQEYLTVTKYDSTVGGLYKLSAAPVEVDTLLLVGTNAQAEATRRLNLWKTPRSVYTYTGLAELLLEELGNYQTITSSRFNLAGSITGQIVSITRDWIAATAVFGVLA